MNVRIASPLMALTLAIASTLATAQTTVAPDPAPAKVGVSQGTAIDAENKAIPRTDTATLVRTHKAHRMARSASATDGSMATNDNANVDAAIDNAPATAAGPRHARN